MQKTEDTPMTPEQAAAKMQEQKKAAYQKALQLAIKVNQTVIGQWFEDKKLKTYYNCSLQEAQNIIRTLLNFALLKTQRSKNGTITLFKVVIEDADRLELLQSMIAGQMAEFQDMIIYLGDLVHMVDPEIVINDFVDEGMLKHLNSLKPVPQADA